MPLNIAYCNTGVLKPTPPLNDGVGGLGWSRGPGAGPESALLPRLGVNQSDGYGRSEGQGPGWTRLGPWLLGSRPTFSFEA